MSDKKDEPTPAEKAQKKIVKGYNETVPGAVLDFKHKQEKVPYDIREQLIKDKGAPGAAKFLNTEDGQKYMIEHLKAGSEKVGYESLKKIGKVDDYLAAQFMGNFMLNQQALAQEVGRNGSQFDGGNYMKVLQPNIGNVQEGALLRVANSYDPKLSSELLKKTGTAKYMKDTKDVSPTQVTQIVGLDEGGKNPQGPSTLRQLGLEDKLNEKYRLN